ncbi:hypothetical protein AB0C12_38425 [Actinoplanes sp. NPDC048967]|uniref:hypothetical protein n=1 Tax=Actinoplanes sp. NPDC048967 TaxID=3155269 RepID=UPI0033EC7C1A
MPAAERPAGRCRGGRQYGQPECGHDRRTEQSSGVAALAAAFTFVNVGSGPGAVPGRASCRAGRRIRVGRRAGRGAPCRAPAAAEASPGRLALVDHRGPQPRKFTIDKAPDGFFAQNPPASSPRTTTRVA